jgi:hypothetical protein
VVAALILLDEGIDWQTSGGMFDWTLEFLIDRIEDQQAIDRLHQIIDNNLGSLWLTEFTPPVRTAALEHLSRDLLPAAEQHLPPSDRRDEALAALRALAGLASSCLGS